MQLGEAHGIRDGVAINELLDDFSVHDGEARVKVLRTNDSWFGVTYREDKPRVIESVRELIAKGVYPEKLWT